MRIRSFTILTIVGLAIILVATVLAPPQANAHDAAQATQAATLAGTVDACQTFVKAALDATNKGCASTGRNQVCYGSISIKAEAQPGVTDFQFDQVGQTVPIASIQKLQMAALNPDDNTWGVALFRIQANLPDTAPGQNVTLLAFGDVDIQNAGIDPSKIFDVVTSEKAVIRKTPDAKGLVLANLPVNSKFQATGRTDDSTWLRVQRPGDTTHQQGWVLAKSLTVSGDVSALTIVDPKSPYYGPMQAFYLKTGIGESACKSAPPNGILVQTPKGGARVNMSINDVNISLGSTAYIRSKSPDAKSNNQPQMAIAVLDGTGVVQSAGRQQTVRAGFGVEVPVDANQKAAGPPGQVHPSDPKELVNLPVQNLPVVVSTSPNTGGTVAGGAPVSRTPGAAGAGSFVCPSGAATFLQYNIPGVGAFSGATGCTCTSGTHTESYEGDTPQGHGFVTATICN